MEDEHEWHISLEVFNPRPRETYRLKFHASPVNILSPTTCVVVFTEAKQDLVFKFLNSLESCPPQYVHVYLFADMIDRDGLTQQLLLCVGHGEWSDLTQKQNTIVLSDIENLVQANVRIHMAKEMAFTKTQCPVFDHHLFQTQKDYAEKIREAYSKLKHDQDQSFFYTDTPIGKMPLWTFPYMASRTKFDEDEVQRVMWNWFRIACIITGITTEDFKEQSVLVKAEIVGEMLTLMSRSQLYVNDTVRLDDGRLRATDQWVMLNTFPGPTSAAFDCEDGAMMILSFWSCFKRMSSAAHLCQEKLFPLNDFILQYNAFLALGKLKVKDKYVAHAFVVLLPVSVAARMINNVAPTIEFHEKLVPIVLESTAYTASINRWGNRLDSIVKYRYLTEDRVIYEKEEAWIRQGVKARRTRNEGRVRALKSLRQERQMRIEFQGKPTFSGNLAKASGELVIDAENICYSIQENVLIKDFSIRIFRGDKIALVGANGIGKSTLLKILLQQLEPQAGTVKLGTNLQIAYFEQLRSGIDFELSAVENVASGREMIEVNGKSKHIVSYLSDFLFTPDRMRTPVKMLSGGECNRLLLAKLFSLPNNLLVLDEPTNDLDIESLELLEEILSNYPGTILLVSHDRTFVNEIATSTLYFEGAGKISEYVGGYDSIPLNAPAKITEKNNAIPQKKPSNTTVVLNGKLKKELEAIPQKIATLELQQAELQAEIQQSDFYTKSQADVAETLKKLAKTEQDLKKTYKRWEELEAISLTSPR